MFVIILFYSIILLHIAPIGLSYDVSESTPNQQGIYQINDSCEICINMTQDIKSAIDGSPSGILKINFYFNKMYNNMYNLKNNSNNYSYVDFSDNVLPYDLIITQFYDKETRIYKYFGELSLDTIIYYPIDRRGIYVFSLRDFDGRTVSEKSFNTEDFANTNDGKDSSGNISNYENISNNNISNNNTSNNNTPNNNIIDDNTVVDNNKSEKDNSNKRDYSDEFISEDFIKYKDYLASKGLVVSCNDIYLYLLKEKYYIGDKIKINIYLNVPLKNSTLNNSNLYLNYSNFNDPIFDEDYEYLRDEQEYESKIYSDYYYKIVSNIKGITIDYGDGYNKKIYRYTGPYDKINFIPSSEGEYSINFECYVNNRIQEKRIYFKVINPDQSNNSYIDISNGSLTNLSNISLSNSSLSNYNNTINNTVENLTDILDSNANIDIINNNPFGDLSVIDMKNIILNNINKKIAVLPQQGQINEMPIIDMDCSYEKILIRDSGNNLVEGSVRVCNETDITNLSVISEMSGNFNVINTIDASNNLYAPEGISGNPLDVNIQLNNSNNSYNQYSLSNRKITDLSLNINGLENSRIILKDVVFNDLPIINIEYIEPSKIYQKNTKNSLNGINLKHAGLSNKEQIISSISNNKPSGNSIDSLSNSDTGMPDARLSDTGVSDTGLSDTRIVSAYAIDLSGLNFTNGSFIKKASGTELWKCKEWSFELQQCNGIWEKIMNIRPGGYYSIDLSPEDPGYIETGVATINTNKPIYKVDEHAIISAVVLDTNGYLVSNASVSIIVTDPLGEVFVYGAVRESQRGIYQINFTHNDIEGNYSMQVIAYKDGYYLGMPQFVNYSMYSEFLVSNNYDFDIIRDAPLTIDPFKEQMLVKINITPLNENITYYNFTEIIPNDLLIIDAPGAIIMSNGTQTYLTWNNLYGNAIINYTTQPPLITPNIILLGKSFINYIIDSISIVFEEFRNWILAIDPEVTRDQGLVVYGDRNPDGVPKYRNWTGTLLQGEVSSGVNMGDRISWMKFRCMRDYPQCLLIVKDNGNDVNFAIFYTDNWTWSGNTVLATQPSLDLPAMDVDCESLSGRCLLVYENNTGANTQFMYRIWNGTSLSSETAVSVTGGENYEYDWIHLYPKKGSNIIGIALQNNGGGTNAATPGIFAGIWNGTAFTNWRVLTTNGQSAETSSRTFYRHFDCAWSGNDFICFYSNNTLNALLADKFNGTTWTSLGRIFNTSGEISEISACGQESYSGFNHSLAGVMFCDVNNDLDGTIWNGTSLLKTTHAASPAQNVNAECGGSNKGTTEYSLNFQCVWEDDGAKALFVWVNNGQTYLTSGSYTVSSSTFSNPSWSSGTQIVANGAGQLRSAYLVANPASNKVFLVYTDSARDGGCSLWTGTSWDGSGCNSATVFETNGATAARGWMTFDWFRNPPPQPEITIITPSNTIRTHNYSGIVNPSTTSIAWDNGTTSQPPGSAIAPITGNEFSSSAYVKISSSDDSRYSTTISGTPTGRYAYQSFNFSIPDSTISMKSLKITHEGYATQGTGLSPSSFYIYVYNWSSDTYVLQKTVFASSVDVISEVTLTSGFNDFIRNRQLYVLIEGSFAIGTGANARADINTDYIDVTVENIPLISQNVSVNASAYDDDGIGLCEWTFYNGTSQVGNLTLMSYTTSTYYFNISDISSINDGFYNLTVLCNDTLNNRRNTSVYVYVDNTKPSINLISPSNNTNITANYALFSWNVTDLIYEVLLCNVTIDNIVKASNVYSTHGEITSRNITSISDGTHYWNVTCIDNAGNRNTSQTWIFDSDITAPSITLNYPNNGAFTRNIPLELNFTVTDAHPIVNCSLFLDGTLNTTLYNVNRSIVNNITFNNLYQGLHFWNISCYDSFGLRGFSQNRNFTYDITPPEVYLNISSGTIFNGTTPILNYTVIDNIDSNLTCNITVNSIVESANIPSLNNTLTSKAVPLLDGYKQWNVTCWDDAGNANTSETRLFQVIGGPLVLLQSPFNGFIGNGSNVTFKYFVQDGNGVQNCSLYINNNLNQTNTTIVNSANNTFYVSNFEEGTYNWSVTCYDTTGYPGSSSTWIIISDRTKPSITLLYPNNIVFNTTPVYFNFTFIDNYSPNATCSIAIDDIVSPGNANFTVYNGTITTRSQTVTNGFHYWNVTCIDLGYNSNTSITWNFTVNVTFPVNVTVITDKIQYQEGEHVLVNVTTRNETFGGLSTNITLSYIFTNNTYSDVPWWNSSWIYRKPIYINYSNNSQRTNKAILVNVTLPYGSITDCRELRVVSDINLSVVESGVIIGDDVTFCTIYFIGDVSANAVNENNYHVYYGNPNATYFNNSISISGNIVQEPLFYDAFNTLTSNWTADTGWDISTGDPLTGNHAHIDGVVTDATIRLSNSLLSTIDFSRYDIVNISFTWGIDGTWDAAPLDYLAYDITNNSGSSWSQVSVLNGGVGAITQSVVLSLNNSYRVNGFNIRFRSTVNVATEDGGFDDFNITGYYSLNNISATTGVHQILINITSGTTNSSGAYNESFNTLGRIYGNYSVVAYAMPPSSNYRAGWGYDWFEIIADNFGPVITILYPSNLTTLRSNIISFNYTAVDYANDVQNCSLYINSNLNQTNTTINESSVNTFYVYLNEGIYYWFINCYDTLGSYTNTSTYTLIIDDTPPIVYALEPNDTLRPSGTVSFTYNVTDNYDTLLLCNITVDSTSQLFNATGLGTINISNITDGLHYWNITCWDNAGNNATSATLNFTTETIPIITLDNPFDGYGVNSTNITLYYYLSSVNVDNCSLILNNNYNQTVYSPNIPYKQNDGLNNFTLTNMNYGIYNWSIICFDTNNFNGTSEEWTFYLDNDIPYIQLIYPYDNQTIYTRNVNFTFNTTDIDDVLVCNLTIDGVLNKTNFNVSSNSIASVYVNGLSVTNHTWIISCIDNAGFIGVSETYNFSINSNVNIVLLSPADNYSTNTGNINFTYIPNSPADFDLGFCDLYINNAIQSTHVALTSGVQDTFVETGFTSGTYTWYINCTDSVGKNNISETRTFIIDTIAPTVTTYYPDGQLLSNSTVFFNWSATDNYDTLMSCSVNINGSIKSPVSSSNNTVVNATYSGITDGLLYWNVTCIDDAGNSGVSSTKNFTVQEAPYISLGNPLNNTRTKNQNITFYYTPTDNSGNISNCSIFIDDSLNQTNNTLSNSGVQRNFTISNIAPGYHNWSIQCYDPSGNLGYSELRIFYIDLYPPIIELDRPLEGEFLNMNDVFFNWTATDYNGTSINCSLYVDEIFRNYTVKTSGASFNITVYNLTDGPHNWSVTCYDDLNNSNTTQTRYFTINQPDLYIDDYRIFFNNTNPNVNETINITANVSNIGGVPANNVLVEFWDGPIGIGTFIGNYTATVNTNSSVIFWTLWNITTGYHIVHVYVDPYNLISELNESNNNATKNISILQSIINYPLNNTMFNYSNISINFTLLDYTGNQINYSIFIDNSLNVTGTTTDNISTIVNINLTQGIKKINVEAQDYLGRRKNSTSIYITIDYTPPQPVINTPNGTWFNTSTPSINISATDNIDLLIDYRLYINNTVSDVGNITNGTSKIIILPSLTDGIYNITLEASDDLNNTANSTTKTIYVDTTAPYIFLDYPANGQNFTSTSVYFNFTVYDNLASYAICNLTIDNINVTGFNASIGIPQNYTVTNMSEGTHYWNITCRDQAFNYNISETRSFAIFIPPKITLISPENNTWSRFENNTFIYNVSDDTGLENCSIIINGVINQTKYNYELTNNALNNFTINYMSSGIYDWQIECYDNTSYNTYNITSYRRLFVDTLSPEPYILTENNSWFNTTTPLINVNITDNMAQFINYTLYVNGISNVNGTIQNNTLSNITISSIPDGSYNIVLEATDISGNKKNSTGITMYIDTIKPTILLISPINDTNLTSTSVELNFTPFDNLANYLNCSVTLDNLVIANFNISNNTLTNITINNLLGGYHYWNVTCIDIAGNLNTSETYRFFVVLPDIYVDSSLIYSNISSPIENDTINITAEIKNIGLNDANNFTVEIRLGSMTGLLLGSFNMSLTINESRNVSIVHTLPIGDNVFYVLADVPLSSNGTVYESNESNNNASKTITVGSWQYILGYQTGKLAVQDPSYKTIFDWTVDNATGGNVFAADLDSNINWFNLTALSRNATGEYVVDDFYNLDLALGMNNNSDSINRTYTISGLPKELRNITVFNRQILNVPVLNSTNNSNFITGILWDSGDGGAEFNASQDVVFITKINMNTTGYNGTYDFELRIPAKLREYKSGMNAVALYAELK